MSTAITNSAQVILSSVGLWQESPRFTAALSFIFSVGREAVGA